MTADSKWNSGSAKPEWVLVPDAGTLGVLRNGFRVLFDPTGMLERFSIEALFAPCGGVAGTAPNSLSV